MAYNGSGTYAAPSSSFNPAVAATDISPTDWNSQLADLSTALSTAICKDGQTTTTALIPFAAGISVAGVTPAFTHSGSGPALTSAGSVLLLGGMILKFGFVLAPGTAGTTITFPVAFPTAILTCWGCAQESGTANLTASSYPSSASQMLISNAGGAGGFQIAWFAIGY